MPQNTEFIIIKIIIHLKKKIITSNKNFQTRKIIFTFKGPLYNRCRSNRDEAISLDTPTMTFSKLEHWQVL